MYLRRFKDILCIHKSYCANYKTGCHNCRWNQNIQLQDNLKYNGKKVKLL